MTTTKCDCITRVNADLRAHNGKITLPLIGRQQPFVQTNKLDEKKRGKVPLLFATFCPFCGSKYPESTTAIAAENGAAR